MDRLETFVRELASRLEAREEMALATACQVSDPTMRAVAQAEAQVFGKLREDLLGTLAGPSPALAPEDTFAGWVELTGRELAFLRHVITEWYVGGGATPVGVPDRLKFVQGIGGKLGGLRLRMADGGPERPVRLINLAAVHDLAREVGDDARMAECLGAALDHRYGEALDGLAAGDWSREEAEAECGRLDRIAAALDPDRRRSMGTYVGNLARWVDAGMPGEGTAAVRTLLGLSPKPE